MTSLLRSMFSFAPRRAAYMTAENLTVVHWEDGNPSSPFVFDNDETGHAYFARYLQESSNTPVYFLVDLVEEEFKLDTIPHVFGADRRALVERKKRRFFRETPYYYYTIQGRESHGRRDDRLLLAAVVNQKPLAPWLELLERNRVPLAGIYSLPILSRALLEELSPTSSNSLLVTLQSVAGLRQTYFQDKNMKISRLAKMPRFGTTPYGPIVMVELEKFHRYLTSLRLLSREDLLEVYILTHGELSVDLRRRCIDSATSRYHIVDISSLGQRLGIEGVMTTTFSDMLYTQLLLSQTPKNHYASSPQKRFHTMHRARTGLLVASIGLLLGSTIWSGVNLVDGLSLRRKAVDTKQKALFYQARYEEARKRLDPTVVPPKEIKAAVDTMDAVMRHRATPFDIIAAISSILDEYSTININAIDWETISLPDQSSDRSQRSSAQVSSTIETDYLYYQVATVQGQLLQFDGNYRAAINLVNRFTETLRAVEQVVDVDVNKYPLDVSSQTTMQGRAREEEKKEANFSMRVTMGIKGDKA